MSDCDLRSHSQVQAILAQYYIFSDPLVWKLYSSYMQAILHCTPDARLLAFVLEGSLFKPILKLLHKMLVEEITPNAPRTLPVALTEAYPWASVSDNVAEAFMLLANQREDWIGKHKDENGSKVEMEIILARELEFIHSFDVIIVGKRMG